MPRQRGDARMVDQLAAGHADPERLLEHQHQARLDDRIHTVVAPGRLGRQGIRRHVELAGEEAPDGRREAGLRRISDGSSARVDGAVLHIRRPIALAGEGIAGQADAAGLCRTLQSPPGNLAALRPQQRQTVEIAAFDQGRNEGRARRSGEQFRQGAHRPGRIATMAFVQGAPAGLGGRPQVLPVARDEGQPLRQRLAADLERVGDVAQRRVAQAVERIDESRQDEIELVCRAGREHEDLRPLG